MPTRTTPTAQEHARLLTLSALALLEITFEPASVATGERFDLVLESLSDQLSDAAAAQLAGRPLPSFQPPSVPPLSARDSRRAQAALRESVCAGTLPGNPRSMRACLDALRSVHEQLDVADGPPESDESGRGVDAPRGANGSTSPNAPAGVAHALDRLHRMIGVYAASHARAREALAHGCSRAAAADSVTRSERALMRCLDRTGDSRILR